MVQATVVQLEKPAQIQALAQPLRVHILNALRRPNTSAGVARGLGKTRQSVNYHLKELEKVGLIVHAGERRKGNFVEQLYQAVARQFVISPTLTGDSEKIADTLRDQVSLAQLSSIGSRLQQDAMALIDLASDSGEKIPSASIQTDIYFKSEQERAEFMHEYTTHLQKLVKKYGGTDGEQFRLICAAYPTLETD